MNKPFSRGRKVQETPIHLGKTRCFPSNNKWLSHGQALSPPKGTRPEPQTDTIYLGLTLMSLHTSLPGKGVHQEEEGTPPPSRLVALTPLLGKRARQNGNRRMLDLG